MRETDLEYEVEIKDDSLLTITPSRKVEGKEDWLAVLAEALFWLDMDYTHSDQDGWQYISHVNSQKVFPMDDYGYDLIRDLKEGKTIQVMGRDNLPDYEDYEWNH